MNNRIEKFLAKPKEMKIGEEMVEISPLSMGDFGLIMDCSSKNEEIKNKALEKALLKTIKSGFPDATQDQLSNFSLAYLQDVLEAFIGVNNLKISEGDKKKLLAKVGGQVSQPSQE